MPGFQIHGYGGDAQGGPSSTIETVRSNRWLINQLGPITNRDNILYAKDLTLPQWKTDRLEVLGSTLIYKYAKNVKWEDVNIVFYDNIGIVGDLIEWRDLVQDITENGLNRHGPTNSGYKRQCKFSELNGKGGVIREITLFGSWPAAISFGKLSYTDSAIKLVELTLSYDYAIVPPGSV